MRTVARAGKAVASAASAAAVATAAQPTAHARAPVQVAPPAPPQRFADSEWLLADVRDGKKVLFQPYSEEEVDESISEVLAVLSGRSQHHQVPHGPGPSVLITEVTDEDGALNGGFNSSSSGATTPTSPGSRADHVIEAAGLGASSSWHSAAAAASSQHVATDAPGGAVPVAAAADDGSQLQLLMRVTGKLLKRPGLQREVVACMMDDPEVAQLILGHSRDLDLYLNAAGISAPFALLPPPTATAAAAVGYGARSHPLFGGEDGEGNGGLLSKVVQAIASYIDVAGGALAFLGGWVRDRLAFFLGPKREQQREGESAQQGSGRGGNAAMGSVMVLVLAVFCMMLIRGNLRIATRAA